MADRVDSSGMVVVPKLPVPAQNRASDPRIRDDRSTGKRNAILAGALVAAIAIGGAVGYGVAPDHAAGKLAKAQKEIASLTTSARVEKDRADGVTKQLDVTKKDKVGIEQKLADLTNKYAETEKKALADSVAAEQKLQAVIDKSQGIVSTEGDEIRLKLVDKVLFAPGDDQLTDRGKAVLAKVAKALGELPDKQIWVQGHTDAEPIVAPPPPKPAKKKKGAKPEPPPPGPRFATNWELSAARALQVVHYLQDVGKIDPTRLAALAFSQYRPVSKTNKALNRRIEIVLYPHKAVIEKTK